MHFLLFFFPVPCKQSRVFKYEVIYLHCNYVEELLSATFLHQTSVSTASFFQLHLGPLFSQCVNVPSSLSELKFWQRKDLLPQVHQFTSSCQKQNAVSRIVLLLKWLNTQRICLGYAKCKEGVRDLEVIRNDSGVLTTVLLTSGTYCECRATVILLLKFLFFKSIPHIFLPFSREYIRSTRYVIFSSRNLIWDVEEKVGGETSTRIFVDITFRSKSQCEIVDISVVNDSLLVRDRSTSIDFEMIHRDVNFDIFVKKYLSVFCDSSND